MLLLSYSVVFTTTCYAARSAHGATLTSRSPPPLGVFTHGTAHAGITDGFERLAGIPIRTWLTFVPDDNGWGNIEGGDWQLGPIRDYLRNNPNHNVILSYPTHAKHIGWGADALRRCASGEFDQHYRKFGENLRSYDIDGIVIRIGWEWEGNWYPWGINMNQDGAGAFGACYRTIVQSIRAGYPDDHLIFDWVFPGWQAERNKTMALAAAGWPGDEYVDVIGIDMYFSEGDMDYIRLQFDLLQEFARSQGKPIAFPEWGLWDQDRPEYIEFMCDAIKDPTNNVLYSVYFNVDGLADHRLEAFPRSLATFKARCAGAQSARPLLGAGR